MTPNLKECYVVEVNDWKVSLFKQVCWHVGKPLAYIVILLLMAVELQVELQECKPSTHCLISTLTRQHTSEMGAQWAPVVLQFQIAGPRNPSKS